MKIFPMQKDFTDQKLRELPNPPLPWEVGKAIYDFMYMPLYGTSQSVERIAERGGFSYEEIRVMAAIIHRKSRPAAKPSARKR